MKAVKSPAEVRAMLNGPVNSIPTTFLRDGSIDWKGVGNIIDTGIRGGSSVTLLTVGDSQFPSLTEAEIAELTRFVVERVAGRALTVAATGRWWTGKAVEFARYCRDLGADVLMSLPPENAAPSDIDGMAAHYRALAEVMPVMLVGCPPHAMLDRLTDVPNICCFKEDGTEAYSIATIRTYGRYWGLMNGGVLARHLMQWPYGYRSFMSWPSSFAPDVSRQYWTMVQANDLAGAADLVERIEFPLFSLGGDNFGGPNAGGGSFPGGWQGVWRAILELHGIAARYLRAPRCSASNADLERVERVLNQVGLAPGARHQ